MKEYRLIALSVLFFIFVCLSDAVFESLVFQEKPFWDSAVFNVSGHSLFLRSLVTLSFLAFGVMVSKAFHRQKAAEEALEERTERLAESNRCLENEIAERKQLESNLRDSEERYRRSYEEARRAEERYRALLDSSPDAIVICDLQGNPQYVNASFMRAFGWTLEELRGTCALVFAESERESAVATIHRTVEEGWPVSGFETKGHTKDGAVLDIRLTASRSQDLTGRPDGMLVMLRDITESKRAELETKRTKTLLSTIVQHLPTAIFLKNAEDLKFVLWNSASEELYGHKSQEVLGKTVHDLFPEDQADRFVRQDRYAQSSRQLLSIEGELVQTKHKGIRVINSKKIAIQDESGKLRYVLGISHDVTERKQAEEALVSAREAAEAANRTKSEFLANMSHEIRTPMNGIIGMTELALNSDLTPEQYEYLDAVRISADSLLKLVNDILDFSKIEAGKLELIDVEFSLRDALGDAMTLLGVQAHQKNLELLYLIPPEVPDAVIGDPGRLRQILMNLVGNAIKFTEEGEVFLKVESAWEEEAKLYLHLTVTDTGPGIPDNKQGKIFDAFEQADGSASRKYGGTGLGLAIVARFCKMMGGDVWVESKVGRGSTFHVTLRLGLQKGRMEQPIDREIDHLKDIPILVVDDNATNRKILEQVLLSWGMLPTTVENGAAALTAVAEALDLNKPFPVIITDCMMPEMDGFELARRLREDPRFTDSTIVMLTSTGERGDAARCVKLGVAAYLLKPVKHSELLFTLSKVLRKESLEGANPALITRHSIRESKRGLEILVAEDNPVNQKVVTRMLERMGHSVTVVQDGVETVELVQRTRFDLVLMDVQMPRMNGIEATKAIRQREQGTGEHLSVIAMTAHAMKGDRERCIEAGMDGYIAKPVRTYELYETIEHIISAGEREVPQPSQTRSTGAVLDRAAIWDRIGGDGVLLREIVALFAEDCPKLLGEIREALQQGDSSRLEKAAHALKGSVSNFAAEAAVEAAIRLERMGKSSDLSEAPQAIARLEREIDWVQTELAALEQEVRP